MRKGIVIETTVMLALISGFVTVSTLYFEYKNNQLLQKTLFGENNQTVKNINAREIKKYPDFIFPNDESREWQRD